MVENDVPEKRRKTDAVSTPTPTAELKSPSPAAPMKAESSPAKATTPTTPAAATPPTQNTSVGSVKSTPAATTTSVSKTTPGNQKSGSQTTTPKSGGAGGRANTQRPSTGTTFRNNPANARSGNQQNNRTPNQGRRTPPKNAGRFQGNQRQNGNQNQRHTQQRPQPHQYNRGGGRGNDRFQGAQGSPQAGRALLNSAGPLHQQLALHAAANRATGVPLRPGGMGMMVRPGLGNGPPARNNFGGGMGRANMTGANAIPINGPRGGGNFGGMSNDILFYFWSMNNNFILYKKNIMITNLAINAIAS